MAIDQKVKSLYRSIFFILLAIVIVANTCRDVVFYFDKTVAAVNAPADVDKLHDNATAEVSLQLDLERAYVVRDSKQKEFLLIPFSDVGYRLMYAVEGPLSVNLIPKLRPPFKGRVVTREFGDVWKVYGQRIKLQSLFAKDGIEIPANAVVVYDAPKELPGLWAFFVCALSILYLVYKAYSLGRPARAEETAPTKPESAPQS